MTASAVPIISDSFRGPVLPVPPVRALHGWDQGGHKEVLELHAAVAALAASLHCALRYYGGAVSPLRVETTGAWDALNPERLSDYSSGVWRKEFARLVGKNDHDLVAALCVIASKLIDMRTRFIVLRDINRIREMAAMEI